MNKHVRNGSVPILGYVPAGQDCLGEARSLGISTLSYKITQGSDHDILVLENTFRARGGPARHLHLHQDEWFYILEGSFDFEIGGETMSLKPGDSLLGPRNVPHVWAFTGTGTGRILIMFTPAGEMESFFHEVTKENAMPPQDPLLWRLHGMELIGPPLVV